MNNITITKDTEELLEFDFSGTVKEANTLRRILISDIPCMAIDTVKFITNTSVLTDEFLANALCLVPLKADAREVKNDETFTLTLKAKNEGKKGENGEKEIITVYSSEIKGKYSAAHDDIPIAKLGPGQELNIIMIVKKGIGRDHTKWMVTCPVGYKYNKDKKKCTMTIETTGTYTPREVLEIGLKI